MTAIKRASPDYQPRVRAAEHQALWRLVEGAVVDTFTCHPDYLTPKGRDHAAGSLTKRIVGQIVGKITEAHSAGG